MAMFIGVEKSSVTVPESVGETTSRSTSVSLATSTKVVEKCSGGAVFIPEAPCDSCGDMAEDIAVLQDTVARLVGRIGTLESKVGNKHDTIISMTDTNNNEVSVTVLAE